MLLMRCAWHRKYHGYSKIYGVGSWRGRGLEFSDGMCPSCSRRWRAEFHAGRLGLFATSPPVPPLVPRWMPRVGVGLAFTLALILAARPVDHAGSARASAGVAQDAVASTNWPAALAAPPPPCTSTRKTKTRAAVAVSHRVAPRRVETVHHRIAPRRAETVHHRIAVVPASRSCARLVGPGSLGTIADRTCAGPSAVTAMSVVTAAHMSPGVQAP
jgi:hypothetical protein